MNPLLCLQTAHRQQYLPRLIQQSSRTDRWSSIRQRIDHGIGDDVPCRWLAECCPGAAGYVIANPVVYPLPDGRPAVSPAALLDGSRQVLLAVGRLGTEKGFHDLLDAFASLAARFPQWDLVILGEGEERGNLEAQRHALGLDRRVYLPGRVGNLGDWYHRADLYAMSSRVEGFQNTLLEALAHGLPVVSMDCDTGPRDIVRHETDGLLVDPQSGAGGLIQALSTLMDDTATRRHRTV